MKPLSKAQKRVLSTAIDYGGSFEIDGLAGVKVRKDILYSLYERAFISIHPTSLLWVNEYRITELGIQALKDSEQRSMK